MIFRLTSWYIPLFHSTVFPDKGSAHFAQFGAEGVPRFTLAAGCSGAFAGDEGAEAETEVLG
jgi:hypothetical protein